MAWTEEKIALLKMLYASNFTMGAIAAVLPEMTRNAVCGKVFRLRDKADPYILLGDVTRYLAGVAGQEPVNVARARRLLAMPGFKEGFLCRI